LIAHFFLALNNSLSGCTTVYLATEGHID
jgi:hypothetical protein